MNSDATCIDERALSKLRWRCRRGLLENDLFIARYFERAAGRITPQEADGLLQLMDLSDPDLLDLLLGRQTASGALATPEVTHMLRVLRAEPAGPPIPLLKELDHDAV